MSDDAFYLRYYVGHKDGDFGGVEYMEVSMRRYPRSHARHVHALESNKLNSFLLSP